MNMAQPKTDKMPLNVISLFGAAPEMDEDEIAVGVEAEQSISARPIPEVSNSQAGPDRKAKSLVRHRSRQDQARRPCCAPAAEEASGGQDAPILLADLDRANATLASYFQDVQRPPVGDEAGVTSWMEKLLTFVMERKATALIDLGRWHDTAHLQAPCFRSARSEVVTLESAGVAAVAIPMLGPQPDDLAPLATFEAAGFRPAATLLVLNEGLIETPVAREEAFARVKRVTVRSSRPSDVARRSSGCRVFSPPARSRHGACCSVRPNVGRCGRDGSRPRSVRSIRPGSGPGCARCARNLSGSPRGCPDPSRGRHHRA